MPLLIATVTATVAATVALALTPVESADVRADVRCVAVIGVAARADPSLKRPGAEFAARVGAGIIDRTKATRDQVGTVMLQAGMRAIATPVDPAERQRCTTRMAVVLIG